MVGTPVVIDGELRQLASIRWSHDISWKDLQRVNVIVKESYNRLSILLYIPPLG